MNITQISRMYLTNHSMIIHFGSYWVSQNSGLRQTYLTFVNDIFEENQDTKTGINFMKNIIY